MQRIRLLLLAFLAPVAVIAAPDTNRQYMIEAKILSIDSDEKIELAGDKLTVSTNGPWNMLMQPGRSADEWVTKLEKRKGVDLLSAPKVVTMANQEATIEISQAVRYLVPLSNDLYRAETLDPEQNPGIRLTVTPRVGAKPEEEVGLKIHFRSNLIEEMGALEGFTARLGKPVISSREMRTELEAPLGGWIVVGGNAVKKVNDDKEDQDMLILLLRATSRDAN